MNQPCIQWIQGWFISLQLFVRNKWQTCDSQAKICGFTFASISYYLLLAGLNRDLNNIVDSSETFESVLPHQNIQEAATQAAQTAAAAEQQAVQQQVQVNLIKDPIIWNQLTYPVK